MSVFSPRGPRCYVLPEKLAHVMGPDYTTCITCEEVHAGYEKAKVPEEHRASFEKQPPEILTGKSIADKKDTNPKDAVGTAKVPWSTVSAQVIGEVGIAMLEGALKYGRHNYRAAGVRASVYYDAVVARHLAAWWEGEDIDPDSGVGLSHITKAIAGLTVLRDSMLQGNWVDDRPPKAANPRWVKDQNSMAKALLEKFPNPAKAYTEKK